MINERNNKKFGGADCYAAKIRSIKVFIIVPHLTRHKKGIVEFIAPVHLKSELKVKDGQKIRVELGS